jgi:hypothetical protein
MLLEDFWMAASKKRLQANRKNALESTGPRTTKGKSMSRFNAAKHGLTGKHLFVNPGYDEEECQRFDDLVRELTAEFQPVGILETKLVGQVAACFVRADRASRCERGEIQRSKVERISRVLQNIELKDEALSTLTIRVLIAEGCGNLTEEENRASLVREEEARKKLRHSTLGLHYLISFLDELQSRVESGTIGSLDISNLVTLFGVSMEGTSCAVLSAVGRNLDNLKPRQKLSLNSEEQERVLEVIAEQRLSLTAVLAITEARDKFSGDALKLAAALPESKVLDRILRYEAAIDRQLYRALVQLERLQRVRAGEFVPAPLKVDGL